MYRVLPLPRLLALVVCTFLGVLAAFLLGGSWASAQTDVPDAPTGVAVYSIESQKLEVRWSTSDAASTTSFKIQWKSGAEEYDSSRQLSSDPATSIVSEQLTSAGDRYVDIITDDAGNDEQLTSAATGAVAAVVKPPLTATVHGVPSSHNGQDAFTFELRFSEAPEPDFSYRTVRDHAFTVTGGSVTYVRRLEPGKNIRWEITVTPDSSADVTIALNVTTDCEAAGAICTEDGRKLSAPLELTVNGPDQQPANPDPADLAPTNLAVRVDADGAALSWDAPAADAATVTGYRVLRSVGASAMTILADTGSDDTTYTDASATTPGETYGYQVLAMRGAETSGGSNTVSVSAPQAPDVPRSAASRVADVTAPRNLTVTIVADGIALSWDAPTEGANFLRGYQILRSRAGAPFTIRKASTHSRGTSYVDSWADWPGMTYTYQVKALRGRNVSEGSNQASLTRPACDGGSFNVTPEDVPVTAVPIVVTSTTQDYFVLFVRPILENDLEVPISVTLGESGSTTLQDRLEPLPAAHYRIEKYPVNDPADVDGDCTSDIDELNDLGTKNPLNRATPVVRHNGTVAIPDRETFERLSYQGTDLMFDTHLIELEFVKFFIYGERADRAGVYFMNTNTHRWHNGFFRVVEFPFRHSMRGVLVFHPNVIAPDGSLGVYRFEFEAWDTYSFTDVHHAYELLAASMPLLENNLSYYPVPEVLPLYYEEQLQYDASRVSLLFDNDIFPDVSFVQLNQGVGFGLLRSLSLEERPHPRDIVIYESLPNDLPRVAGIITTVPQTPLSHVNLRALQDRAPNAFIRDALDDDTIDSLIGSLVQYTVLRDSYTIRAASKSELDAHYEASRPAAAQAPVRDLSVTAITALSGVAFGDWDAFGVKAANVAVLGTLGFTDGTVPGGFAVPFYFYDEFMKANELDAMVTTMLADTDFQASYDTQEKELKKLRKAIKDATTPAWMITALEEMHAGFPEGTSLRYRSSTNNEDLPGFSGAGLYDSKTQDPDETEEDGIDKSIKGVWASLWNFRAFVERDFNRIDHSATAMGVLVHPNYSDELANGVAVSYDPFSNRAGGYYVNTQIDEDLVTNPEALSVPEQLLLLSDGSYEVIVRSNQVESNELLMTDAQIAQLRGHLATIHSSFKTLYAPAAGERFAMEIEFKITSDNVLAIKQARPWVFRPLNEPAAFPNTETGERTIAEGTPSNVAIGDPVAATDPDNDTLTYSLDTTSAASFDISSTTGQLQTKAALDFEDKSSYTVTVSVRDSKDSNGDADEVTDDTITVTIQVANLNEAPVFPTSETGMRSVYENTGAGMNIGDPFTATDPDNDTLTYSLNVTSRATFDIVATTGQLQTKAALDYEDKSSYTVTVSVRDSKDSNGDADEVTDDTITVTIQVANLNEAPVFPTSETGMRSVYENTGAGMNIGDPFTATDPDNDTLTYSLDVTSRATFDIVATTGQLQTKAALDYEDKSSYTVTVSVRDSKDSNGDADEVTDDTITVTIQVANLNEAPVFPTSETGMRSVYENTGAGMNIGEPVAATDDDNDTLTYSLDVTSLATFDIVATTGQLQTKAALDYETGTISYTVTVTAVDPSGADDTITVTITVNNVDEAGTVTLSSTQPVEEIRLTASLEDPDDVSGSATWSWARSPNGTSSWTRISGATSASYTPVPADVDRYLRATASYTDGEGSGKSAQRVSANRVQPAPVARNEPPVFTPIEPDLYDVDENTVAGEDIGPPVTATDPEGDTLTYSLDVDGAASFDIGASSGQLLTKAALDYETGANRYTVTVTATDPAGADDTITVTITVNNSGEDGTVTLSTTQPIEGTPLTATLDDPDVVVSGSVTWAWAGSPNGSSPWTLISGATSDSYTPVTADVTRFLQANATYHDGHGANQRARVVSANRVQPAPVEPNEPPEFLTNTTLRNVDENTVAGVNIGEPVAATDPEGDTLTYSLDADGAASFDIVATTGQLRTKAALDFETPANYFITVTATDTAGATDTITVTITVNNIDEPGTVTLSSLQPIEGTPLTATLDDPDDVSGSATWLWAGSPNGSSSWTPISGETSATYTPVAADVGDYLRATASYNDGEGGGKSAQAISANAVEVAPGVNVAPVFTPIEPGLHDVDENTVAGENIGAPVAATDGDNDTLTYSLDVTSLATFDIVATTGQLRTKGALNFETTPSYSVTVTATDTGAATDTITVTITVNNVDEAGTVTLSSTQPVEEIRLTATLDDPDDVSGSATWSWARSPDGTSPWTPISGASDSYTPVFDDVGDYLRATASYIDGEGPSGKSAQAISANAVEVALGRNAPVFKEGPITTRSVPRNTPTGSNIGAPVSATDADNDALTYSLGGADAADFDIAASSGQLQTRTLLSGIQRTSYSVFVSVSDGKDDLGEPETDPQIDTSTEVTINITTTSSGSSGGSSGRSGGGGGGGGGSSRATPTPTPTPSPTPTATPTPTGPQFSGLIADEPSVTATVVPEGTTLGLNGGADLPGGVYVNFPPTAVALPVQVSVSVSNEAPSDVVAPSGTTLLPLTIDISPATPLALGEPLTIEINPTPEQLEAAGGDLNKLAVGVVTPHGIVVLPAQVLHGRLVVTIDHLSTFVLLAVTDPGPVLTQPPMGDASSMGPLLQWTQPPRTTWFQVQVIPFNEDGPGINLVIGDRALVQAAQYQVLGPNFGSADPNYVMLPDMTYLWQVRTATVLTNPTEADWSAWAVSSFKTPPASSSTITPVSPQAFGQVSTLTATLTWANANTAVFYYEVQVSRDFAFGTNAFLYSEYVHGGASTPANSYVVPEAFPLEAGEIYYWRVRPRIQGDGDPLPWSATYVFLAPG